MKHKATLSIFAIAALTGCNHETSQLSVISTVSSTAQAERIGFSEDMEQNEVQYDSVLTAELFTKILTGDTDGVSKLLSLGANPNGKNSDGVPALLSAIKQNRINIAKVLLRHKADANCADLELTSPLMQVVSNRNNLIPKTLSDGTVIYIKPDTQFNKYLADILLSHGADPAAKDINEETALMRAAALNNVDAVVYLLEKGSDPNQKNSAGQTPLMVSSKLGFIDVAKCLIKGKADIATIDNEGQTVLIVAAQAGDAEMVRFLISKGALVDAEDVYGATPLKVAKAMGHEKVVSIILENQKPKDLTGLTPKAPEKAN